MKIWECKFLSLVLFIENFKFDYVLQMYIVDIHFFTTLVPFLRESFNGKNKDI